jgi:hypothetical protein
MNIWSLLGHVQLSFGSWKMQLLAGWLLCWKLKHVRPLCWKLKGQFPACLPLSPAMTGGSRSVSL